MKRALARAMAVCWVLLLLGFAPVALACALSAQGRGACRVEARCGQTGAVIHCTAERALGSLLAGKTDVEKFPGSPALSLPPAVAPAPGLPEAAHAFRPPAAQTLAVRTTLFAQAVLLRI